MSRSAETPGGRRRYDRLRTRPCLAGGSSPHPAGPGGRRARTVKWTLRRATESAPVSLHIAGCRRRADRDVGPPQFHPPSRSSPSRNTCDNGPSPCAPRPAPDPPRSRGSQHRRLRRALFGRELHQRPAAWFASSHTAPTPAHTSGQSQALVASAPQQSRHPRLRDARPAREPAGKAHIHRRSACSRSWRSVRQ